MGSTLTYGQSVSISVNTIVIGANAEDSLQTTITNGTLVQASDTANNLSVGAAYIFKRTGNIWVNEAYFKATNAEGGSGGTGDNFGGQFAVSISADTIVVGANQEDSNQTTITNGSLVIDNNSATNSGAAYVFRRK